MLQGIRDIIEQQAGGAIRTVTPVSGGDINEAYRITTACDSFFLKVNRSPDGPAMLNAEYQGLQALSSNGLPVPEVISSGQHSGTGFLLMGMLQVAEKSNQGSEEAGRLLAQLHTTRQEIFGFEASNFIGSIPQDNSPTHDWPEFYIERRIEPLIKDNASLLGSKAVNAWHGLKPRLPELLECNHPALLHGDLWGGNYLFTSNGPVFIDPAVYCGDRLMDIAMTRLFGGFSRSFYDAYFETFPLSAEVLEERVHLYQLYYLLVHVALFGRSYVSSVEGILQRFA